MKKMTFRDFVFYTCKAKAIHVHSKNLKNVFRVLDRHLNNVNILIELPKVEKNKNSLYMLLISCALFVRIKLN